MDHRKKNCFIKNIGDHGYNKIRYYAGSMIFIRLYDKVKNGGIGDASEYNE